MVSVIISIGIISIQNDCDNAHASLNLGIINLVPFPALDGGRLFLLLIEAIRGGKKINPEKEAMINMIGFCALMAFMVFITYSDVTKLFKGIIKF